MKPNNDSAWENAVNRYDNPQSSQKKKRKRKTAGTQQKALQESETDVVPPKKKKREERIRVSNPNVQTHDPYIRTREGGPSSTLANRSDAAQDRRLREIFIYRMEAAFPHIPTYKAPMTRAQLQAVNSADELTRVVPIMRKLMDEGKVISCSTRVVDPETGETLFLYLGDRYLDDKTQYENPQKLGNTKKPFSKPLDISQASARKYLVNAVQNAKSNGIKMVHDGFHENTIDAYTKSVQAMAFVNPPQNDQTSNRHGTIPEDGKSFHRFPIAPDVDWTSKPGEAGLQNTQSSRPGRVYSDQPGQGCEPAGVWHFIEGREQIGHHGQGLYLSKDMCANSSSTTAVATMYKNTEIIEANVEAVVKVAFPELYPDMKAVWSAGKMWERDSGCHIARAVVYKMPVHPHVDDKDFAITLSFGGGRYTGGWLYIPQFNLVFEYGPRSLSAFFADCIIHSVGDWEAVQMEKDDETTPGRIGTVFYIPQSSAQVLMGKEPGWGKKTNYGRFLA